MMHVSWFAPFYSGGGYCTEAQAIIASLHVHNQASSSSFSRSRGNLSFGLSHHGDSVNSEYLNNGLSQNEKNLYFKIHLKLFENVLFRNFKYNKCIEFVFLCIFFILN